MEQLLLYPSQQKCFDGILNKIKNGHQRITVIMSPGTGKTTVSAYLGTNLTTKGRVLFLFDQSFPMRQMKEKFANGTDSIITFSTIFNLDFKEIVLYDYIIFFNISSSYRYKLNDCLKNYQGTTISFGDPYQDLNDSVSEYHWKGMLTFVYTTLNILDIRDSFLAGYEEKAYLRKELIKETNLIEEERQSNYHLISSIKNEINVIDKKSISINNQIQEIAKVSSSEALEKQLLETKILLEALNKQLNEKEERLKILEKENKDKEQLLNLQSLLLNGIGITSEEIMAMYNEIETVREELHDSLESIDLDIKEKAVSRMQNIIADLVYQKTQKYLVSSADYEAQKMQEILSEKVWKERLSEKSRAFLVTAKVNLESMSENSELFDYSGVCLLVTKALEVEITERFFTKYIDYLKANNSNISTWPDSIKQKNGSTILNSIIPYEDFTLGSVVPLIGLRRSYRNGNISGYSIKDFDAYSQFVTFAHDKLFDNFSFKNVKKAIENDYLFIEKVRVDYRNPAAHKNALNRTSATDCFNYVIEVQKMLKVMLEEMKI